SLPLISIIVPCYNKEKYISNCLNSLKCQTYDNLQLILVDDCSTDGTKNILEEFVNKAPNAELHLADGKGVSHARNLGISLARGKYLTFLDADDFISPYHVETLFNALVTTESDLSVCRYKRVGENSVFSSKHFKKIKEGKKTLFDKTFVCSTFYPKKSLIFAFGISFIARILLCKIILGF
ncbi:MAG: glycosyltransferase family 2 protein, partial [Clostridiales bacterium]|nr:glycosyltransferase family 2 protein [Clostridiales bacterium]